MSSRRTLAQRARSSRAAALCSARCSGAAAARVAAPATSSEVRGRVDRERGTGSRASRSRPPRLAGPIARASLNVIELSATACGMSSLRHERRDQRCCAGVESAPTIPSAPENADHDPSVASPAPRQPGEPAVSAVDYELRHEQQPSPSTRSARPPALASARGPRRTGEVTRRAGSASASACRRVSAARLGNQCRSPTPLCRGNTARTSSSGSSSRGCQAA